MADRIRFRVYGYDTVLRRLQRMKQGARNRVLRPAVTKALKPLLASARSLARVRTGLLRRSLHWKTLTYRRSGVVVGLVGARTGFKATRQGKRTITPLGKKYKALGINPVRYAHLVEFGHGGPRPARPYPFLRPAWDANKALVARIVQAEVAAGLARLAQ